ncbi:MAG: nitrile hydratase subunit alpha, partial [Halobacterium sp.]
MTDSDDTNDATSTGPLRDRDPEARARALQSLLTEKGLVTPDAVDDVVSMYEDQVGPLTGAKAVARAWVDDDYRDRLLADGLDAVAEVAPEVPDDMMELRVVENTPDQHNLVVCTLCSCYPWAVLGLPPTWYKTPAYRSRAVDEPRALLREEFDTAVP